MLEEAAPLTEPPRGGWLGEWLLSVWAVLPAIPHFGDALGTFRGARGDCSRGDRACDGRSRDARARGMPRCRVLGF